jgi:hypothetical protein
MQIRVRTAILALIAILLLTGAILTRATLSNLLSGRVHFPDEYVDEVLTMEDGQKFTVFRRLQVDGKDDGQNKPAVFVVRFKFRNLDIGANKRLSIIPAPFLIGMKGFCDKVWTINEETMTIQGIYQWSSQEAA